MDYYFSDVNTKLDIIYYGLICDISGTKSDKVELYLFENDFDNEVQNS